MIQNISTKTWDGLRSTNLNPVRNGELITFREMTHQGPFSVGGPTNNEEAWSDTADRNKIDVCAEEIFWGSAVHQAILPRSPSRQSRSLDVMTHMRGLVSNSGRIILIYRHCGSWLHPRWTAPHLMRLSARVGLIFPGRVPNGKRMVLEIPASPCGNSAVERTL